LKARLENDEAIVFIARSDEVAVGFTMIYPTFSTVSLSNVWLLNDLYVEEANRGQRIASKLMETAESAAREAGATRVFLRTANDNTTAQSLYEGRGYLQDEVFRRYDLIF
jgi:ribosomal protein S18 acetylase RimI-like enzyme